MAHDPAGVRHDRKGKKNKNADALREFRVPRKRRRAPNERRTVLTTGEVLSRRDSTSRRRVGNVENTKRTALQIRTKFRSRLTDDEVAGRLSEPSRWQAKWPAKDAGQHSANRDKRMTRTNNGNGRATRNAGWENDAPGRDRIMVGVGHLAKDASAGYMT